MRALYSPRSVALAMVVALAAAMVGSACAASDQAKAVPAPAATVQPAVRPSPLPPTAPGGAVPAPAPTRAPAPAPTSAPSAAPTPAGQQPQYGGRLQIATRANPSTLNPYREGGIDIHHLTSSIHEKIIRRDPSSPWDKIVPELATQWSVSNDGKTYDFTVRQGVKWQDGAPLTADDMIFYMQMKAFPPKDVRVFAPEYYNTVQKVEKVDDYHLRVTLKTPDSQFLSNLAESRQTLPSKRIWEKDLNNALNSNPVGTGPFKFDSFKTGISFSVSKNPGYWRTGRPYLDGIDFFIITDQATQFAAFRTGRVDVTAIGGGTYLKRAQIETVQKDLAGKARMYNIEANLGSMVRFNTYKKPFDDIRVRQAIYMVLDREAVLRDVAEGSGCLGEYFGCGAWALPRSELEKEPGWPKPTPAVLQKAKELLAQAGFPNGFDTQLGVPPASSKEAEFVQEQLRSKLGINVRVVILSSVAEALAARGKEGYPLAMNFSSFATGDPIETQQSWYGTSVDSAWNDPETDRLYNELRSNSDPAKRKDLALQLQRRLLDQKPGTILYWQQGKRAVWNHVNGVDIWEGAGQLDNHMHVDTWLKLPRVR